MDSEEIDKKIESLGQEIFDSATRKWLTNVLIAYHSKLRPALINPEHVELEPSLPSSQPTPSTSKSVSPESITPPSPQGPSTSGGDLVRSVPKIELLLYTIGQVVSSDSLMIPRNSTILEFKATYEIRQGSQQAQLTKSVIVKLIDDEEVFGDDDKENDLNPKEHAMRASGTDDVSPNALDVFNPVICEYNFYMKIVPELEQWAASRGVPFKFGIPQCIYGNYIPGIDSKLSPLLFDSLSTLVLDDVIENDGYIMKTPGIEGLTLLELKLAIAEIAKIHAVSWAYQECTGVPLKDKFAHFFDDLHEQATEFADDIQESIPEIDAYFRERGDPVAERLRTKVLNGLLPRIRDVVHQCFIPASTTDADRPLLCLVHTNFWHQNLLFKNTSSHKDEEETSKADADSSPAPVAIKPTDKTEPSCRILDWEHVNVSQPMLDVACLLFRSASPTIRREHLEEFIEVYSTTFKNVTTFLRIPTIYDLDYFKRQYQNCSIFPILLIMSSMAMTLCDDTAMELFLQGLLDLEVENLI